MSHTWWSRYQFGGVWRVAAPTARVFAALDEPADYPRWWPEVREVIRCDQRSGVVRFRSFLPYELRVGVRAGVRDEAGGRLEILLSGDLEGRLCWSLFPVGRGTLLVHAQDCVVTGGLPLRLGPLARPAFRANHAAMMRSGERGLRAWLRE
ncbi:polyketide cyclase [Streptomyces sp. 3MP-14]|uniref:Polyketide cyclase n=1 Tax=Streptomyces mimosae TaxID=2586635 RepID=A0A5N6A3V5_9ACTN|nr:MULTISPECIES: polyketide cyclase [Streptomyces]KAB8162576.1 polyketide cyclase [Streptomyces mimosae]KAB8174403.1 polyketide cyclase [Streptomyces sp. 3MP-14]